MPHHRTNATYRGSQAGRNPYFHFCITSADSIVLTSFQASVTRDPDLTYTSATSAYAVAISSSGDHFTFSTAITYPTPSASSSTCGHTSEIGTGDTAIWNYHVTEPPPTQPI